MTKTLELRETPQPVALSSDQLKFISNTEFVPPGLRGNLPAILACVTTGRELGLGDMTALRSIHVIDGKATFSAELMVQLVRKQGHSITGDVSADAAKVTGKRVDNGDTMTVEWTLAMAERVGLLSKSNWKKYPEAMLWARAVSQLCRMLFADCFVGASYTPEELGAADGDVSADELMYEGPVESTDEPVEEAAMSAGEYVAELEEELRALADGLGNREQVDAALEKRSGMDGYPAWLVKQVQAARQKASEVAA